MNILLNGDKTFTFSKNIFKLNNHSKSSIVKNAIFANIYICYSNNMRAGEADTSAKLLWLTLQNGTDFGSDVRKPVKPIVLSVLSVTAC